jgi:diacylglycerol kinase (ATP)
LENAVLVGSLAAVLIAELLNTGVEKAIDRIDYDDHPLSKFAKDAGSAGVFIALVNVPVTWGLILLTP